MLGKALSDSLGLSSLGEVCHALLDVAASIRDLVHRPTHVTELTRQPLDYDGQYCNASAASEKRKCTHDESQVSWHVAVHCQHH